MLLLFDVGAVIWLIAGRPWPGAAFGSPPYRRAEEQRRRYREEQQREPDQD